MTSNFDINNSDIQEDQITYFDPETGETKVIRDSETGECDLVKTEEPSWRRMEFISASGSCFDLTV